MKSKKNNKRRRFFIFVGIVLLAVRVISFHTSCKKKEIVYQRDTTFTLAGVIASNFEYSLFYHAMVVTGLFETLKTQKNITVLLPNNMAWNAMGIFRNTQIDSMDKANLNRLLRYHIIASLVSNASVPSTVDNKYKTINDLVVFFSKPTDYVSVTGISPMNVNGFDVVQSDVIASNGIIQVIAGVLKYPSSSLKAYLDTAVNYSLFTNALRHFSLYDQLDEQGPFVLLAPTNDVFARYNITLDSIAHIDTSKVYNYLFSIYVLKPYFFFRSDAIFDAPIGGRNGSHYGYIPNRLGNLQTQSGNSYFVYSPSSTGSNTILWGGSATLSDYDHYETNGILHGIDDLILYPDSLKKQ